MFTKISNLLKDGEILHINIMKTREGMVITVLPLSKEVKDPTAEQLISLNLKGSPKKLDEGFIEAIRSPVQKSTELMTNMAEYEKSAEKAAAESKAEKDRKGAIDKHVKEAETHEKAGKHREALAAYTKVLELDKKNVKIRLKINTLKRFSVPYRRPASILFLTGIIMISCTAQQGTTHVCWIIPLIFRQMKRILPDCSGILKICFPKNNI